MMGQQVAVYMDGQPCDMQDVAMMRPKDIERIEYYDAPVGKYSKDNFAINFVLKQYRYGGYVLATGTQTIGYGAGDYTAAATLNSGNTTYSLFAGGAYTNVEGSGSCGSETFRLPAGDVRRNSMAESSLRDNNEYVQLRLQNRQKRNYLVGKLTLYSTRKPEDMTWGEVEYGMSAVAYRSDNSSKSLTPKFDLNGELAIANGQTLNYGLHGTYARNSYDYGYAEGNFATMTHAEEDAYSFSVSAIYNKALKAGSFTAEAYHYHNIWNSTYSGNADLWQHLWKGETLAFLSYNRQLGKRLSLRTRLGLDWLLYRLHGNDKFSQFTPRAVVALQYQLPKGMLMWQTFYANPTYGMNVINNAEIGVSPYMTARGNPDLRKGQDAQTYIYLNNRIGKLNLAASAQYSYSHNAVLEDYCIAAGGAQVIRTYNNDFDSHIASVSLNASWPIIDKLNIGGGVRYLHTSILGYTNYFNNSVTGNANIVGYLKSFSVAAYVNFRQKSFDFGTPAILTTPLDYGLQIAYKRGNFFSMLDIVSPFTKRRNHLMLDTPAYEADTYTFDRRNSRFVNITVQYSFDFGHKTERVREEIDKSNNSAILKL